MSDQQPSSGTISALNENLRLLNETIKNLRDEMVSTYVRKDVYEAEQRELRGDVQGLKNWLLWGQRIVIGAVIAGLLFLVIKNGGGTPTP